MRLDVYLLWRIQFLRDSVCTRPSSNSGAEDSHEPIKFTRIRDQASCWGVHHVYITSMPFQLLPKPDASADLQELSGLKARRVSVDV